MSPAARFATIEKARSRTTEEEKKMTTMLVDGGEQVVEGVEMESLVERKGNLFPGILSPGPGSLHPIPPGFFSSSTSSASPGSTDPNLFGLLPDLSPVMFGNRNYSEGGISSYAFFSPQFNSPTPSFDLFNNFSDP